MELQTVVPRMVRHEHVWKAVETFATEVLTRKEVAEREREARGAANVMPEDR